MLKIVEGVTGWSVQSQDPMTSLMWEVLWIEKTEITADGMSKVFDVLNRAHELGVEYGMEEGSAYSHEQGFMEGRKEGYDAGYEDGFEAGKLAAVPNA